MRAQAAVPSVGRLAAADVPHAARVLARAFRDNPLNVAVVGPADAQRRLRSNELGSQAMLGVARHHGEVWAARLGATLAGALIGTLAHGYPLPPPPVRQRMRCLLGQGWRVARRWAEVFEALDALHPREPHCYLGTLGVDPDRQRLGVGTALLRHWLTCAEEEGVGVYLETDRAENVAFYGREGFEVVRQAEVVGVKVWCMQRQAQRREG